MEHTNTPRAEKTEGRKPGWFVVPAVIAFGAAQVALMLTLSSCAGEDAGPSDADTVIARNIDNATNSVSAWSPERETFERGATQGRAEATNKMVLDAVEAATKCIATGAPCDDEIAHANAMQKVQSDMTRQQMADAN